MIRTLSAADRDAVRRHLQALDRVDRCRRFLWAPDDGAIADYAGRMDFRRGVVVGGIKGGRLVALAEAQPTSTAREVEVAVSVLPGHRRRGMARRLAAEVVASTFAAGAERAVFVFDPGNAGVAALARTPGVQLTGGNSGVVRQARMAARPVG